MSSDVTQIDVESSVNIIDRTINTTGSGIAWAKGPTDSSVYIATGPMFSGLFIVDTANRIYKTQTTSNTTLSTPQNIHTGANFKVNTISLGQSSPLSLEEAGPKTGVSVYANQYNAKNDFVSKSQIIYSGFVNQFQNTFATTSGSTFTGNCGSINISNTNLVLNTVFPTNSYGSFDPTFVHNGILIDQSSFYTPNPSPFTGGIPNIAGLQISALGNGPIKNAYGAMIRQPLTGTTCSMGILTDSLSVGGNNITVRPPSNGMLVQGDITISGNVSVGPTGQSESAYVTEKVIVPTINCPTGTNIQTNWNRLNILTGGIIYGIPTNPVISYIEGEFTAEVRVNFVTTKFYYMYQIEGDYGSGLSTSTTYFYTHDIYPGTFSVPTVWYYTIDDATDAGVVLKITSDRSNWQSPPQNDYTHMITYNCPSPGAPRYIKIRYIRYGGKVTLYLDTIANFTGQTDVYDYHATPVNATLDYYYTINNIPSRLLPTSGTTLNSFIYMKYNYVGLTYYYYHVNDNYSSEIQTTEGALSDKTGVAITSSSGIEIRAKDNGNFKARSTTGWSSTIISYTIDPTIPYT
jgi:hypothetical protein